MKGLLIYEPQEIIRNQSFIDRLINAGKNNGLDMQVMDDQQSHYPPADFIFFRSRNVKLSKELAKKGVPLFNRAQVNEIANDKYKALQFVQLLGISTVPTQIVKEASELTTFPVVLKTIGGHGGMQVELFENEEAAKQFIEKYKEQMVIAQQYIETNATDVRVFMLGTEVIGAVKRIGAPNSFKSNYTLGGTVEKYELDTAQIADVQKIARALKSDYIGMDFLLLPNGGWIFNELEDPVGARSFFQTTQTDIAIPIMNYIKQLLEKE